MRPALPPEDREPRTAAFLGRVSHPDAAHTPQEPLDLRRITDEQLDFFWLPPRPDPAHGVLLRHWRRLVAGLPRYATAALVRSPGFRSRPPGPTERSRNWSGARIAPHGARFSRISGHWTLPALKAAQPPAEDGVGPQCSVWVGLDGHRRWSKALPQLGTVHAPAFGAKPEQHAPWVQWWIRGQDEPGPFVLDEPPVEPGGEFLCSLTLRSPTRALMVLRSFPKGGGEGTTVRLIYDATGLPDAAALGASADWIVERPLNEEKKMHPLAAFEDAHGDGDRVLFRDCAALAGAEERRLQDPRLIRMIKQEGLRSRIVAVPRRRGEEAAAVAVRYAGGPP